MSVKALVFVATDPRRTRQTLEKLPQPAYVLTGRFDGVTLLESETLQTLGEQVFSQVRGVDGVTHSETYPVLREVHRPEAGKRPVRAFVLVRTQPNRTEQVFGALAGLGETSWAAAVSGRYDVAVQLGANSWDELTTVLLSRVRQVDGVESTATFFVAN